MARRPGSTTADIGAATLSVSGATAANKTYDGTTIATVSGGTPSGLVNGDSVTLGQTGSFSDKNVASGKTVTESFSISGNDAGNCALASSTATTTANISAAALTVSANNDNRIASGIADARVSLYRVARAQAARPETATLFGVAGCGIRLPNALACNND